MNANRTDTLRRRLENAERNKANCAAAIARNKGDIASLLDHLGQLVQAEGEGETDANWGIVGSLAHVREHLIESVQFLSGLDREDVESALDDMRQK